MFTKIFFIAKSSLDKVFYLTFIGVIYLTFIGVIYLTIPDAKNSLRTEI